MNIHQSFNPQKVRKNKIQAMFISKAPPPPCYEQNRCTECTLQHLHDKDSLMYNNKQLLDEVCCDMKIINVEVRVISQAEGKDDNSYGDIDNLAYHKNRIQ